MSKAPPLSIEFYNAVSGAAFQHRLISEWRAAGSDVTEIRVLQDADYRAARGRWQALGVRARIYALQALRSLAQARRRPPARTVRVATTNPFYSPALVAWAGRRSIPTVQVLYDLYPDALIHAGKVQRDSLAARVLAQATRYALQRCAATVFLGERLRAHTERTYGPARRAVVIPVGADGGPFRDKAPRPRPGAVPRILYSGLLGAMHDSATLAAFLSGPGRGGIEWSFHAAGSGYARLRSALGVLPGITWGPSLPTESWILQMTETDVALVTIAPGAEHVVMPSKTYSALVAGQAILAICPSASDLADLVREHKCGWVVEPGDIAGLEAAVASIRSDPSELLRRRQNAFAAGHAHFDIGRLTPAWNHLFDSLDCASDSTAETCARVSAPLSRS